MYLTFADSQLVHANFLLIPHVVVLDTVVATAKRAFGIMRGFEERRAMGIGYFVTREDLEKRQSWRMSEVISQIPGANILRTGAGHAYVSSSHPSTSLGPGGRASVCLAVIFLDGVKVYAARRGEPATRPRRCLRSACWPTRRRPAARRTPGRSLLPQARPEGRYGGRP